MLLHCTIPATTATANATYFTTTPPQLHLYTLIH